MPTPPRPEGRPIHKDPAILDGAAHVKGTKHHVWALVRMKQLGASDIEVIKAFPGLKEEDLRNAWKHTQVPQHAEQLTKEIDDHLAKEVEAASVHKDTEKP